MIVLFAECKRLCNRVQWFRTAADSLKGDGKKDPRLDGPLNQFQTLVGELEVFLRDNLEPTSFDELCQIESRQQYCDSIAEYNTRLTMLVSEISGILSIDSSIVTSAVTRSEDFEDLQLSFTNSMRMLENNNSKLSNRNTADAR